MTFNPRDHIIVMERKSKKKDAQGRDTWETTQTEYLPVQWRLCWFREENPKGKIESTAFLIDLDRGAAIFETRVERDDGGSARMHGSETASDWKDYIEKAQTKSLGRALAAVGYGSQFTGDEFIEGERIADTPVPVGKKASVTVLPVPGQGNGHHVAESMTDQQEATIKKLCQHLGKPLPSGIEAYTFKGAQVLLAQLSKEYKEARDQQNAR